MFSPGHCHSGLMSIACSSLPSALACRPCPFACEGLCRAPSAYSGKGGGSLLGCPGPAPAPALSLGWAWTSSSDRIPRQLCSGRQMGLPGYSHGKKAGAFPFQPSSDSCSKGQAPPPTGPAALRPGPADPWVSAPSSSLRPWLRPHWHRALPPGLARLRLSPPCPAQVASCPQHWPPPDRGLSQPPCLKCAGHCPAVDLACLLSPFSCGNLPAQRQGGGGTKGSVPFPRMPPSPPSREAPA